MWMAGCIMLALRSPETLGAEANAHAHPTEGMEASRGEACEDKCGEGEELCWARLARTQADRGYHVLSTSG